MLQAALYLLPSTMSDAPVDSVLPRTNIEMVREIKHYVVENAKKIVKDDDGTQKVVLYGRCDDSKVYKKILQYLSSVSEEISWCTTYTKKRFTKTYKILLW